MKEWIMLILSTIRSIDLCRSTSTILECNLSYVVQCARGEHRESQAHSAALNAALNASCVISCNVLMFVGNACL